MKITALGKNMKKIILLVIDIAALRYLVFAINMTEKDENYN